MAVKLPDHAHCEYCGDPIQFGETHCSEDCKVAAQQESAKEKRLEYITYLFAGILVVAVGIIGFFAL